jgi:signal transduction histidine kinase
VAGVPAAADRPEGGAADAALLAQRRTRLALATLLVLFLALAGLAIFATERLHATAQDRYVKEAFPLRTYSRDLILQLLNEETAVRGYVITADPSSLQPYRQALPVAAADLAGLQRLTERRPEIAASVARARRLVGTLDTYFRGQIALVASGPAGQRGAQRNVLGGKALFDRFRAEAGVLLARSEQIVADAERSQRSIFRRTLLFVVGLTAVGLAIGTALLLLLPERMRRLYRQEQDARLAAEQGARAARALRHVGDAVILLDADDTIRYWNSAAATGFDLSESEALDRPVRDVLPRFQTIDGAGAGALVPLPAAGEERWFAVRQTRFPEGRVLVLRDVTAERHLEHARSDFLATASHELRTPLAAVYGAARTLRRRDLVAGPELNARLLEIIEEESERLGGIVDQIIVSAQLDGHELHLDSRPCELRELCESLIASATLRAPVGMQVELDAPPAVWLECDPARLRQVLGNLLDNAVKYSPDGGRIDVRVRESDGTVAIEVADHGLGLSHDAAHRAFEKFYRADPDMIGGIGGSGLGLYISRELVEQMGGAITVDSELGAGSTFTVVLPSPTARAPG